jgi:hypothetical protein
MKIVNAYPPNIDKIREVFTLKPGIVFTYEGKLYNPDGGPTVSDDLLAHEETHVVQQKEIGGSDAWWSKYFVDIDFRLEQELEAYRNQYRYALEHYNRPARRRLLKHISKDLSGVMYGNIISEEEAVNKIKDV